MGGFYPAKVTLMRVDKTAVRQALADKAAVLQSEACAVPRRADDSPPLPAASDDEWIAWAVATMHQRQEGAWKTIGEVKACLAPPATKRADHRLYMLYHCWPVEMAFECVLALFQGIGVWDFMPENEDNTFFVVYKPAQLYEAFTRMHKALRPKPVSEDKQGVLPLWRDGEVPANAPTDDDGRSLLLHHPLQMHRVLSQVQIALGPGAGDPDNQKDLDEIMDFLVGSVASGADTAILFSNPS